MLKRLTLLVGLLILLAVPRPAHAVPGMCSVVGTVYNLAGQPLAGGSVIFRSTSVTTFGPDTVAATPEYVTLDGSCNIPAGVQVPLGARFNITVQGDPKAHSVVVTNNPANCPLAFGSLLGSTGGGVATTTITSINTTNNVNGLTLSVVNPPAAGPASLTLNPGVVTSWTPTILGDGGNPTVTYTQQVGRLAQIGNFYWFNLWVGWSSISGGGGNADIGGFPLTQNSGAGFYVGGLSWNWGGITFPGGYSSVGCQIGPGTSLINLEENGSGVVPALLPLSTLSAGGGQLLCQGWGSL